MKAKYSSKIVAGIIDYQQWIQVQNFVLTIVLLMFHIGLSAQYRVTPCSDISPRPISYSPVRDVNMDILSVFLDEDSGGNGGEGCWVYHHPNGKDFVVIPDSWHQKPFDATTLLIEEAMTAITDVRKEFSNYGDLHNDLYIVFDEGQDSPYAPFAYWLVGGQCWIRAELNWFSGNSADQNKYVFAHEIGHCFVMENVKNLHIEYDLNAWFDESVSEYLATEVYTHLDRKLRKAKEFELDSIPFKQEYKAWHLWYFYAKRNGKSSVVPLMKELVARPSRSSRLDYMRSIGFDILYHEFLFEFYRDQLMDVTGEKILPHEENVELRQDPMDLIPDSRDPLRLEPIPPERMSLYEITLPASYDVIINPPRATSDKVYYSLLNEPNSLRFWEEPVEIRGKCDEAQTIQIIASHLNSEPVRGITVEYELKEREACCDDWVAATVDNPSVDELNGDFYFDYYIESELKTSTESGEDIVPMKYFVNSKDGSMLMLSSFFMDNFNTVESDSLKADGVIWYPNGQLVGYVQDKLFSQKRAITLDINQTQSDVKRIRQIMTDEFLRMGSRDLDRPADLPPGSQWRDRATGYAYQQPERYDPGQRNKFTGYISNDTTFVTGPLPSFGFMVGFIRDQNNMNKLLVYSRLDRENGEFIEAHLNRIERYCATFIARGYKKFTLMGDTGAVGAMTEGQRANLVQNQKTYYEQLNQYLQDLAACGDDEFCIAEVKQNILRLEKNRQDAVYDLTPNRDNTGTDGTDLQRRERQLQYQMYNLEDQIIENERRCATLSDQNVLCDGCMDTVLKRCMEQRERLMEEKDQLECQMARLHGAGDMIDNCD